MSRTPPTTSVEIVLNIVLFFSQYALRSMNEFFRTLTFSYVYDVMRLCQGHCRGYQFQWPQQRLVYSPVKHQRRSFFLKIANRFQRVTICIKISIIDLRQGPKYAFDKKFKNSKLFHVRVATALMVSWQIQLHVWIFLLLNVLCQELGFYQSLWVWWCCF